MCFLSDFGQNHPPSFSPLKGQHLQLSLFFGLLALLTPGEKNFIQDTLESESFGKFTSEKWGVLNHFLLFVCSISNMSLEKKSQTVEIHVKNVVLFFSSARIPMNLNFFHLPNLASFSEAPSQTSQSLKPVRGGA